MVRFTTSASAVIYILSIASNTNAFVPSNSITQTGIPGVIVTSPIKAPSRLSFMEQRAVSMPSINVGVDSSATTQYLVETLISNGVPAFFWIVVIAFAAKSFKSAKDAKSSGANGGLFGKNVATEIYDDLYGGIEEGPKSPFSMFGRPSQNKTPKNLGIPKNQFFKITKLNEKYESFQYSLTAATQSKAKAAAQYRAQAFDSALTRSIDSTVDELSSAQKMDLLTEEKQFLKRGGELLQSVSALQGRLTDMVIQEEMKQMDVEIGEVDAYKKENVVDATIVKEEKEGDDSKEKDEKKTSKKKKSNRKDINKLVKEIEKENTELLRLEIEFIRAVIDVFGPNRANAIRAALVGNIQGGGAGVAGGLIKSLQDRPLSAILDTIGYTDNATKKNLFVSDFPGDVSASQVETLREEVTAIVRAAKPGDEVLVVLQTGGGTVTGYGLAAAQLQRFKKHGMKLTICVEQVAASGGYMMTCVADKVIASPFAVLGSIGVISDLPNVYERLKSEGIEFQTVTAGKYKRTLTPTKKVTKEDLEKSKADLEDVLKLFKGFVAENRPSLDIDNVATGETWFGQDALEMGLCDELKTVDDVLTEYVDDGYDVYEVKYDPIGEISGPLGSLLPATERKSDRGLVGGVARWLVKSIVPALKDELASEMKSLETDAADVRGKYMMKDEKNAAERIRIEL